MPRLRDLSFRYKIPLRGSLLVVVTAAAVTAALIAREYDALKQDLVASSASMGRLLAKTLVTPMLHDDVWRAFEIINAPFQMSTPDAGPQTAEMVTVLDGKKRIYVSTHPSRYPMLGDPARANPDFNDLQHAISRLRELESAAVEMPNSDKLYVLTPVVSDGVTLGTLVMGYSKTAFLPRFLAIARSAGVVTLIVIAVLLPASWYWARRFAQPLVDLAQAMGQVGVRIPQDAEVRVQESGDELGRAGAAYKAMLEELRKKESLEREVMLSERLAAVGRLAAGVAHEINNPLGGMLNAINTYKRHGNEDPMTRKTLSLLERGLLQIRDSVVALLVEARVESHPLMRQDIEDTHLLVLPDARRKSARFEWENDIVDPLPVPSTPVRQILINLLLNALQAVGERGAVACRVYHDSRDLHISVANDGAHMSQQQIEGLFEPFGTTRAEGHGLGLWVTYQIIDQLGGEISVFSEPGETRFRVCLPLEREAA